MNVDVDREDGQEPRTLIGMNAGNNMQGCCEPWNPGTLEPRTLVCSLTVNAKNRGIVEP